MKLAIIAVGQRVPQWAQQAWDDFAKRFPPEIKVELKTVKTENRASKTVPQAIAAEEQRIQAACASLGKGVLVVVLDERGHNVRSLQLAQHLREWQTQYQAVAVVIGGPDGLSEAFRRNAGTCLRLSDLTLPHALARVLLIEQLYRAWSLNAGHPYHRE